MANLTENKLIFGLLMELFVNLMRKIFSEIQNYGENFFFCNPAYGFSLHD